MKKTVVTLLLAICLCGPAVAQDLQDVLTSFRNNNLGLRLARSVSSSRGYESAAP